MSLHAAAPAPRFGPTRKRGLATVARVGLAAVLGLGLPTAARAQAPITSAGLGYPVAPVDGRAAALGSTGIGLLGGTFSLRNPADLSEHVLPGFGLALVAEGVDLEGPNTSDETGRQRFAVIRAVVPFGGWTVGLGFGGELDQDWAARFQDTLSVESGSFPFVESREHDGGVAAIDLSLARRFGPVSIGVSAQRLTGSLRQTFFRDFQPTESGPILLDVGGSQLLDYGAWRFKGGAAVNVGDRVMVSGVVGLPGALTAEPEDSTRSARDFDLPRTFEVGASARVIDELLLVGGAGWADWSVVEGLEGARAHDTFWGGLGIEWEGFRLLGGQIPVRLGARRAELPFSFADASIDETAITGGLGWIFRQGMAALHLALEVGKRGDMAVDGVEESFRRLTISFTLRQPRSP